MAQSVGGRHAGLPRARPLPDDAGPVARLVGDHPELQRLGSAFKELLAAREWADYSPEPRPQFDGGKRSSPFTREETLALDRGRRGRRRNPRPSRRGRATETRRPPRHTNQETDMKFTLSWLKDHLETQASLAEIVDTLTRIGLEVEGVEDPGAKYAGFVVGYVVEAKPHPNADRLQGMRGRSRLRPGSGGMRRAQRAHRHEERVLAGRDLYPGQEDHARQGRHPRRRIERHALLGGRARAQQRPRRHHGAAGRRAGRRRLCALRRARRSGHRRGADPEPPRRDGRRRHRARPRRRRPRHAQDPEAQDLRRRVRLPDAGPARLRGPGRASLPGLRAAGSCAA